MLYNLLVTFSTINDMKYGTNKLIKTFTKSTIINVIKYLFLKFTKEK